MLGCVHTFGIHGIVSDIITCECLVSQGLPVFEIVGLPDTSVKEAKERVRAAAKTSGFQFPACRITVNLSPANLKKTGGHYDVPILLGILIANNVLKQVPDKYGFVGELGLDGAIHAVPGVLTMALAAKRAGFEKIFVPAANAAEAALALGPQVIPVRSMAELYDMLRGRIRMEPQPFREECFARSYHVDYKDVLGQDDAKRSMEIAAAGGHNVLLIGPPGSGKSMISKRLPTILPDLSREECLEVTQIYSVLGMLSESNPLIKERPFRAPHHTISNAGLVGGGTNPRPGEISMAHKGVLFLDEFPEFKRDAIDLLRQPLEDGKVTISRSAGSITFPSQHMLVCAMNPCPCGWHGYSTQLCRCTMGQIERYRARISGPMLDRIDMIVEVPPVAYQDIRNRKETVSSAQMKRNVDRVRRIQFKRFGNDTMCNAHMGPEELRAFCKLDDAGERMIKAAFDRMEMTARSYDRTLRLARTIADMAGSEQIRAFHLAEALNLREMKNAKR